MEKVSTNQTLQTRLKVLYGDNETDITTSLMPDLLSLSYTDNETNTADEVSIILKDEKGKWAGTWKPEGGDTVKVTIISGTILAPKKTLNCGTFYVDTLSVSGSPRVFEIRAVSIPLNTPIRKRIRSKSWEKVTLKDIAQTIAKDNKLSLLFDTKENPSYDRQDQQRESDLKFLGRLSEEAGLSLKVTGTKLVVFDQSYYEKKDPIATIKLGVDNILSWNFEQAQSETYKSVNVTYRNPKLKKKDSAGGERLNDPGKTEKKNKTKNPAVLTYIYTDPDADEDGQEYMLKKRASSVEEAKRLARAKLRQLNLKSVTGSITLIGNTRMVAGAVVKIVGFGSFDGNFYIESADHEVSSSGYTTTINIRRVNTKY